jgi:excisionase family DNA binding protein
MQTLPEISDRAYLTADDIAPMLGVTRDAVLKWARNGTLPSVKIASVVRVPRAAFEELLAKQTRPARG